MSRAAKRAVLIVGLILLFAAGVGVFLFEASRMFPGITPSRTAHILINDGKFGGRAIQRAQLFGDWILEPLRKESKNFTWLTHRTAFRVAFPQAYCL